LGVRWKPLRSHLVILSGKVGVLLAVAIALAGLAYSLFSRQHAPHASPFGPPERWRLVQLAKSFDTDHPVSPPML
jgi:hypothetical protein